MRQLTGQSEYGYTVNDVIVPLCAAAVRRWLIEHDELPAGPVVAQVSVRADEDCAYGNRVGMMSVPLFTNVPDPALRLRLIHEALRVAKERQSETCGS